MSRPAAMPPEAIRAARRDNAQMRERDLAAKLGISECEFVAAFCGEGATRIASDVNALLPELQALGEVMALTRNESAVHEKVGIYDNVHAGERSAMVLAGDIDLRIFPANWVHGFAVERQTDAGVRRSLQFFDAAGDAVHKIHLRPAPEGDGDMAPDGETVRAELRDRWQGMTDVHQFFGILQSLKLRRHEALGIVGEDLAWRVDRDAVSALMHHAAEGEIPIMCFVGNRGCIQIYSGPVRNIRNVGP